MQRYFSSIGIFLSLIAVLGFGLSPLSLYYSPSTVIVGAAAIVGAFLLGGWVLQRFWRYDS
jgi:hypothetical protein